MISRLLSVDVSQAPAFLLPLPIDRDFVASVSIKGKFVQQYDQAVLFLHMTHTNGKPRWVKTGVERDNDINWIGQVILVIRCISRPDKLLSVL